MNKFYLDDLRSCPKGWVLARTYKKGIELIKNSPKFDVWSLDHDLGGQKTGYDLLFRVSMECPDKLPDKIYVHSSNYMGSERILGYARHMGIPAYRRQELYRITNKE